VAERDSRRAVRGAARGVLCNADGVAATGTHGRRLRARLAARDRHPLCLRVGLRHAARGRIVPHRVPRRSERAAADLRRYRRVHTAVSAAGVTASSDSPRTLIRYALVGLALTVSICWALWEVRDALVLVYISALVAIGLSPLVNAIERKRLMRQRVPRWAAILVIYLCIIGAIVGVAILVIPPIVKQARELVMELPRLLHQGQQWLVNHGLLTREISAQEAVQQTAGSSGAQDTIGLLVNAVW